MAAEGISNAEARKVLEQSGTDPKYKGLYAAAETCIPPSAEQLARVPADIPNYRKPGDLAAVMVDVDLRWEHLEASKAASWKVPPKHPDVDPPHEARMLWEHYVEIARTDDAKQRGPKFLKYLSDGESAARALEEALRAGNAEATNAAHARSKKACSSCHTDFRDN